MMAHLQAMVVEYCNTVKYTIKHICLSSFPKNSTLGFTNLQNKGC